VQVDGSDAVRAARDGMTVEVEPVVMAAAQKRTVVDGRHAAVDPVADMIARRTRPVARHNPATRSAGRGRRWRGPVPP
jgi:hypothetical protein